MAKDNQEVKDKEREIRLDTEQFDNLLKKARLIDSDEAIDRAWIEPGELIIKVVK